MQVDTTLTNLDIHPQDPPIGAAGEAALVPALQVRCPSINHTRAPVRMHADLHDVVWYTYRTGHRGCACACAQVNVGLIEYRGPGAPLLPMAERQANRMRQQAAEVWLPS